MKMTNNISTLSLKKRIYIHAVRGKATHPENCTVAYFNFIWNICHVHQSHDTGWCRYQYTINRFDAQTDRNILMTAAETIIQNPSFITWTELRLRTWWNIYGNVIWGKNSLMNVRCSEWIYNVMRMFLYWKSWVWLFVFSISWII